MKLHTLCIATIIAVAAIPAQAATTSVGDQAAVTCALAASSAPSSAPSNRLSLQACNEALAGKQRVADRTATLVNRGILLAASNRMDAAMADFDAALVRDPQLASAHVSRGAALMQAGRHADAKADFTRALSLNAAHPEKVYFNRGMANEKLGDVNAAYGDYRQAAALAPDFAAPHIELARFQVVPRRVAQSR